MIDLSQIPGLERLYEDIERTILGKVDTMLKGFRPSGLAALRVAGGSGGAGPAGPPGPPGADATPLTGDVTTSGHVSTLVALHGVPITSAAPNDGEFLVYSAALNRIVWRPGEITTPANAVTSNGDLVTSGGEYVTSTP